MNCWSNVPYFIYLFIYLFIYSFIFVCSFLVLLFCARTFKRLLQISLILLQPFPAKSLNKGRVSMVFIRSFAVVTNTIFAVLLKLRQSTIETSLSYNEEVKEVRLPNSWYVVVLPDPLQAWKKLISRTRSFRRAKRVRKTKVRVTLRNTRRYCSFLL